jgi:hypothetical protein
VERQADHDAEHARAQGIIKGRADAHQNPAADEIERALEGKEGGREYAQADQGRDAAAGQDAIIDFEHEERARQIEHVDHGRHQANADKEMPAARHKTVELGAAFWAGPGTS